MDVVAIKKKALKKTIWEAFCFIFMFSNFAIMVCSRDITVQLVSSSILGLVFLGAWIRMLYLSKLGDMKKEYGIE